MMHFHKTETGVLVKCYHKTTSVFKDVGFWIGLTLGFPIEHYLWEHVYPFSEITKLLGL